MRRLRFAGAVQDPSSTEAEVTGRLESLRQPGEATYFSPVVIAASTGAISSQVLWFQLEMLMESLLCAFQAACLVFQVTAPDPRASLSHARAR